MNLEIIPGEPRATAHVGCVIKDTQDEVGGETGVAIQGPLVQYFEFQMKDFVQTMCCFKFLSKEVV